MNIRYNGSDITGAVQVCGAVITDRAGGRLDRAELTFRDPEQAWQRWGVRKEDKVSVTHLGYDTGTLYVSEYRAAAGEFTIVAVSAPPSIRQCASRAWENVRLKELLWEFAARAGLKLETYGLPADPLYARLEQRRAPDAAWLNALCERESCVLKIMGGTMVVYYEPWLERRAPARELTLLEGTGYLAETVTAGIYAGCHVQAAHPGEFADPQGDGGPWLEIDAARCGIQVSSQGEAERIAKGLLRARNKYERLLRMDGLPLDMELAGGSVVQVTASAAEWSGRWVADSVRHDLHRERTRLSLRKPLEGY